MKSFMAIAGIGGSFISMPANICVQYYFIKRRPFAIGLAGVGTSLGILEGLPAIQFLINYYGWRGAFIINTGKCYPIYLLSTFLSKQYRKMPCYIKMYPKLQYYHV